MKNLTKNTRRARAGFSLVELVVSTFLLASVFGAVALVGSAGTKYFRTSVSHAELEARARRTLMRIQDELLHSDQASLTAFPVSPAWDDRLPFAQPNGIAARDGSIDWRSVVVELRYEEDELDDGIDNDGDGVADECMVVLIRDAGGPDEMEVVLCRGVAELLEGEDPNPDGEDDNGNGLVDERGLSFESNGQSLAIHLTLAGRDAQGFAFTRSFETEVWLRN